MNEPFPRTVHYTELPDLPPDDVLAREWQTYKREMPRLLAEGQEGRFVLIKGDEVIGIWDTWQEAARTGRARFGMVPIMVHEIQAHERILHLRAS
jgi:hypothetical protein